jgi:hypothetical protein
VDLWTEGVSDTQREKYLGDGAVGEVVRARAQRLLHQAVPSLFVTETSERGLRIIRGGF